MSARAAEPTTATMIEIRLPWTPPSRLSPNSTISQRTKNRLRRDSKDISTLMTRNAMQHARDWPEQYDGPVSVAVVIRWEPRRYTQDRDNIISQCKGILDGLENGGAILNDRQIDRITITQEKDPEKRGETVLLVEAIGDQP